MYVLKRLEINTGASPLGPVTNRHTVGGSQSSARQDAPRVYIFARSFLLPSSFREIGDCPKPHDGRIELRMCSEKYVAVASFSGWCSENIVKQKLQDLILKCKNDRLISDDQEVVWQLAQYNPPFTIPQFRRNEVWVTLEGDKTEESILHALSHNK